MKRFVSSLAKIGVTLALLYWVFTRHDLSPVFAASPLWIVLAIVVFIISNFVGAYQWQKLLQGQGIEFAFGRALNLYFIGLFFNTILPGALGGDVVRVYSVSRVERKGREGLAATFVDRFAGFFVMSLFAIGASLALIFWGETVETDILVYIVVVFLIFLTASAVIFSRRITRLLYEVLLARVSLKGLRDKFREGHEFFHAYRKQYGLGLMVFLLSVVIQFLRIAVHYLCARAIGFEIGMVYFLLFVPLIALAAVVPVSFGGLGVRESTGRFLFATMASIAAVDPAGSLAVTTQLLASLVGILVGLAGGVMFALTRHSARVEVADIQGLAAGEGPAEQVDSTAEGR